MRVSVWYRFWSRNRIGVTLEELVVDAGHTDAEVHSMVRDVIDNEDDGMHWGSPFQILGTPPLDELMQRARGHEYEARRLREQIAKLEL